MAKKTFDGITNEHALEEYEHFRAVWRTRAFRQFREENRERVKQDLQTKLGQISQKSKKERNEVEPAWLNLPFDGAMDEALKREFCKTDEWAQVLKHLRVFEPRELAINYDFGGNLFDGKFLDLRINLTFSKERIMAEFESILNEMHPKVKRPPTPTRGLGKMDQEKIDLMFRAFELVEDYRDGGKNDHQSILQATLQLNTEADGPLEDPPASDKRYQQVMRWHQKVKGIIGNM